MNKDSKPNRWLSLINIPIQMGVTIYLFHLLGTWLDTKYNLVEGLANKILSWPVPQQPGGHLEFFVERLVQRPDFQEEKTSE